MKSLLRLGALILPLLFLLSCPNPIDRSLLLIVEDEIPPELLILSPLPSSLYSWTVEVEGTVTDSSNQPGDRPGGLQSLSLTVLPRPELNRLITFDSDGGVTIEPADPTFTYSSADGHFRFELSMLGIADPLYFTFTATDLNGRTTERMFSISADPTKGPYLVLNEPMSMSNYGVVVNVLGTVLNAPDDPQTSNVASLFWEVAGTDRRGELDLTTLIPKPDGKYRDADGSFEFNPSTGAFSDSFSTIGLKNTLGFVFRAVDRGSRKSEVQVQLLDSNKGPYLVLSEPANLSGYGIMVNVRGTVLNAPDDPQTSNVASLSWEVPGTDRRGELDLTTLIPQPDGTYQDVDGSFVYNPSTGEFRDSFSTIGLKNTLVLAFRSLDRSGRKSEVQVQLLDPNTGPQITISGYDEYYSSAVTANSTVSGTVMSDPSNVQSMSYIVKQTGGGPRSGGITGFADGNFDFTFVIPGLSGRLTVEVYAVDMAGRGASDPAYTFDMYDDPNAPAISLGTLAADNSYIDVTFNEATYASSGGSGGLEPSDFNLNYQPNGSSANVTVGTVTRTDGNPLAGGETAVRVNLSRTGTLGGVETINVAPANGSAIYDHIGNPMPVSSATGLKVLHDQQVPTVAYVSSTKDDRAYGAGTSITITVQLTEVVTLAGGLPTLALNSGGTATYSSGSGSLTLSFGYTVAAGENSSDLDYVNINSLSLNGAVIQDSSGNSITSVVLPDFGSGNSLGDRKNLVIDTAAPSAPTVNIEDGDDRINNNENNDRVKFTITGEPETNYTITPTNCMVTPGYTGKLPPASELKLKASVSGLVGITVVLTDAAGNSSQAGWHESWADLIKPEDPGVTINDGDGYINYGENEPSGVLFTITGEAGTTYTITPTNCIVSPGTTGTMPPVGQLRAKATENGTVVVAVVLTDAAGNDSNTKSDSSEADLTAPTVGVDDLTTNDHQPALSGTVNDTTATIQLRVFSGATPVSGPHDAVNNGDGTWRLANNKVSYLSSGTYTVEAVATDVAGNSGTDTGDLIIQ